MTEQLFEIGRRHFDTPEFRGIEFIEVEARRAFTASPTSDRFGSGRPHRKASRDATPTQLRMF